MGAGRAARAGRKSFTCQVLDNLARPERHHLERRLDVAGAVDNAWAESARTAARIRRYASSRVCVGCCASVVRPAAIVACGYWAVLPGQRREHCGISPAPDPIRAGPASLSRPPPPAAPRLRDTDSSSLAFCPIRSAPRATVACPTSCRLRRRARHGGAVLTTSGARERRPRAVRCGPPRDLRLDVDPHAPFQQELDHVRAAVSASPREGPRRVLRRGARLQVAALVEKALHLVEPSETRRSWKVEACARLTR